MGVSLVMVDIGLHHAQRGVKLIMEIKEQEEDIRKKKELEKDKAYLKRRVTTY